MAGSGLDSGGSKAVGDGAEGGRGPGQTQPSSALIIRRGIHAWCMTWIVEHAAGDLQGHFVPSACSLLMLSALIGQWFQIIEKTSTMTWTTGSSGFWKCHKRTCVAVLFVENTRKLYFEKPDIHIFEELKFGHSEVRRITISDILSFGELRTRPS